MEDGKIGRKQLWLWLLAAMSAPIAQFSGVGILSAGLTAAIALPLAAVAVDGWGDLGKGIALTEMIGTSLILGSLISSSGSCWPGNRNELVVPLTILLLGALSGTGKRCARVGSVIAMVLLLLYLPLAASATGQIRMESLRETNAEVFPVCVMLIPSLVGLWNREKKGRISYIVIIGVMGILFSTVTQGMLGLTVAMSMDDAFWQASRCLGRFEPVTAVALTLGWYVLTTFLTRTVCRFGESCGCRGKRATIISVALAASIVLLKLHVNVWILNGIASFLWVLVPVLNGIKKLKKIEKNT